MSGKRKKIGNSESADNFIYTYIYKKLKMDTYLTVKRLLSFICHLRPTLFREGNTQRK